MKNLKLVLAVGACMLLPLGIASAQGGPGGGGHMGGPGGPGGRMGGPGGPGGRMGGGRMMERMATELKLTDAQKKKLQPIFDAQGAAMRPIFMDTKMTRDQKMAKMTAIRTANDKKIMAVLTPDQRKKFAQMQAERAARMKQGGGGWGGGRMGGGPGGPGGHMGGPGGPGGQH